MSNKIHLDIREIIAGIVNTGFAPEDIPPGYQLAGNALDSMAVTQLIIALEEHFAIAFDDEDLTPQDFDTVDSLTQLVQRKLLVPK